MERAAPEPETAQAKDVIHELEGDLTPLASVDELMLKCSAKLKVQLLVRS